MGNSTDIAMAMESKKKVAEIVKDYGNRLFGFVRGKVGSPEDAEDILQEVWFQLSRMVNLGEIEQVSGWLYKVARNKIIDKQRKNTPEPFSKYLNAEDEEGISFIKEILIEDPGDPDTEYLKEVFWRELFTALDELPEKQRAVFVQNELEDLTLQQIADKEGEKLKTIISRKGYAVKYLRKRLSTFYEEFLQDNN